FLYKNTKNLCKIKASFNTLRNRLSFLATPRNLEENKNNLYNETINTRLTTLLKKRTSKERNLLQLLKPPPFEPLFNNIFNIRINPLTKTVRFAKKRPCINIG